MVNQASRTSMSVKRDLFAEIDDVQTSGRLVARRVATPIGDMLALADGAGLRLLDFLDRPGLDVRVSSIAASLGRPPVDGDHPHLDALAERLDAYFAGAPFAFDVPLAPLGSGWQRRVWDGLRSIPRGETRSYSELASAIGHPSARRAVGLANGRNPLAIVVPCHRVIRADGSLSGYSGGPARKRWLLDHERGRAASP